MLIYFITDDTSTCIKAWMTILEFWMDGRNHGRTKTRKQRLKAVDGGLNVQYFSKDFVLLLTYIHNVLKSHLEIRPSITDFFNRFSERNQLLLHGVVITANLRVKRC